MRTRQNFQRLRSMSMVAVIPIDAVTLHLLTDSLLLH